LAYGTLRLTTDVPAKRAFLKQLRDKYRNQEGLSKAWGIELSAWELMEDPGFEAPLPDPAPGNRARLPVLPAGVRRDLLQDHLRFAEMACPNHLLLGGRFAVSTPEAVKACAEFCDVLSFNFYTLKPRTVMTSPGWPSWTSRC
jgi:hypothetical protein